MKDIKLKARYKFKDNQIKVIVKIDNKKYTFYDILEDDVTIDDLVCEGSVVDYWNSVNIDGVDYDININDYVMEYSNYFLQLTIYSFNDKDYNNKLITIPIKSKSNETYYFKI